MTEKPPTQEELQAARAEIKELCKPNYGINLSDNVWGALEKTWAVKAAILSTAARLRAESARDTAIRDLEVTVAKWNDASAELKVAREEKTAHWVIVATGEGATAHLISEKNVPYQAVHDFMCVCRRPWENCAATVEDVSDLDDSDEWQRDEYGNLFSISWRYETGCTTLYRLAANPAQPKESQ